MVEVKNLCKRYGDVKALDNVSFSADAGEILGFLGPNGAGKSTTMNIITGYLSSTSGTVTVDGDEVLDNPRAVKSKIGYLPEIPPLYIDMTVIKYLEFMFDLKRVRLPKEEHIKEVMQIVGIADVQDRLIKNLSKGYKQRVGFAQALLGNPPVLILDEPTVGLDPKQIIEIRSLIKSLGKKHTVIFSSHVLSEVAATCDRVVMINNGKIVADSKTDRLAQTIAGTGELEMEIEGSASAVSDALTPITGIKRVSRTTGQTYIIEYDPDLDVRRAVFRALAKADLPILMMRQGGMSLEESFLRLTEQGGKA